MEFFALFAGFLFKPFLASWVADSAESGNIENGLCGILIVQQEREDPRMKSVTVSVLLLLSVLNNTGGAPAGDAPSSPHIEPFAPEWLAIKVAREETHCTVDVRMEKVKGVHYELWLVSTEKNRKYLHIPVKVQNVGADAIGSYFSSTLYLPHDVMGYSQLRVVQRQSGMSSPPPTFFVVNLDKYTESGKSQPPP